MPLERGEAVSAPGPLAVLPAEPPTHRETDHARGLGQTPAKRHWASPEGWGSRPLERHELGLGATLTRRQSPRRPPQPGGASPTETLILLGLLPLRGTGRQPRCRGRRFPHDRPLSPQACPQQCRSRRETSCVECQLCFAGGSDDHRPRQQSHHHHYHHRRRHRRDGDGGGNRGDDLSGLAPVEAPGACDDHLRRPNSPPRRERGPRSPSARGRPPRQRAKGQSLVPGDRRSDALAAAPVPGQRGAQRPSRRQQPLWPGQQGGRRRWPHSRRLLMPRGTLGGTCFQQMRLSRKERCL